MTARKKAPAPDDMVVADKIHSAAIRLLRRLRTEDDASGLSAPRASALSVLAFVGPQTLGDLARAEQVKPPTITRLIQEMEREGLVAVAADADDKRVKRVKATAKGKRLLIDARQRRVMRLARGLTTHSQSDQAALAKAATLLLELAQRV